MFDSADSDQDGVDDGTEVARGLSSPNFPDYDSDNDGFYEYEDCNDLVGSIFPGATEQWNGIDDDCDDEVDELVNRLELVIANHEKSSGTVFLSNREIFDGPYRFESGPLNWDSANESFWISLTGIRPSLGATISWSMSGYSLEMNSSDDVEIGQRVQDFQPGQWNYLMPGESVHVPDIDYPSQQYEMFVKNKIRRFATGFGCSFETISKDFSETNYSSSRLSLLEDREH